jgi:hypothetical protein
MLVMRFVGCFFEICGIVARREDDTFEDEQALNEVVSHV